jgi:hypothetical protein
MRQRKMKASEIKEPEPVATQKSNRLSLIWILCGFLVIGFVLYSKWIPITQNEQKWVVEHSNNHKIIAIGDLHGDLPNTLRTFRMAGLIDQDRNWIAGKTTFVQTGDIVDRGPDTIELYQLMQRLIKQAQDAGGKVIPLLGNHEIMNLANDLRYVTPEDFESFGGYEARQAAWSKTGWIGQYLRKLGIAAWVDGVVFFHGGAHPNWSSMMVKGMNEITHKALNELDPEDLYSIGLFGNDGPLWYRGYALAPESSVCQVLDHALKLLNATRMVVGHTPQMDGKVLSRCEQKVFVIDVGISRVYGGHSAALEIQGSQVTALYPNKRVVLSK